MDVNGTQFQLLLGHDDWASCSDGEGERLGALWSASPPAAEAAAVWDAERNELTLRPEVFQFAGSPLHRPPRLTDRRGAGRDAYGNWYWIAVDGESLLVESVGDGSTMTFWPSPEPDPTPGTLGRFGPVEPVPTTPRSLSGAAVTQDQFLVVGTLAPAGLLVFDLQAGGGPLHLPWPSAVPFLPFDMAPREGGGVFVLDAQNGQAWELDRHLHVVPAQPQATSTTAAPTFASLDGSSPPEASSLPQHEGWSTPVSGQPIAIEALAGSGFLILDRNDAGSSSLVAAYRGGEPLGQPVPLIDTTSGVDLVGHDFALVDGTLFVVDAGGNQAYAFMLSVAAGVALTLFPSYYPMRLFEGKGLVSAAGKAWYDFGHGWIALVCQPRSRYVAAATIVTPVLDGGEPGCVWHRLMLDADISSSTAVAVSSIAADEIDVLAGAEWLPEPDPRPRAGGSEIPYVSLGPYETYELLFQQARGRYLQVRLDLIGDGRSTPRIRALRAWYPRFSYLSRYLPAAYREDSASASFLDRYLANVEGISTALEDRIADVQVLLNPQTVPAGVLDWLAGWLGLTLDPMWDERRRRLLLANAMAFFATRGTIRGLQIALRFVLDPCVDDSVFSASSQPAMASARIVEAFRTRRTPGVIFGDPSELVPATAQPTGSRWDPTRGRDALNAAFASYLEAAKLPTADFPILDPADATSSAWQAFSQAVLGFVPAAADPASWEAFLERRYANPGAALAAYGLAGDPSAMPPPPTTLPANGAALIDWFQFQGVIRPMTRLAHRFSVLVPWPLQVRDSQGALLDQTQLSNLATRVVELQRPAHTTFDVKFFWAAFRVGEARLGDDTLLATGSRAPELLTAAIVGADYLGSGYLGGPAPGDVITRTPPPDPSPSKEAQ